MFAVSSHDATIGGFALRTKFSLRLAALAGAAMFASAGAAVAATPTYAVTGRIAGPDGGWDYASFDPVHRRLYVSRTDGVTALDVDTGVVTAHLTDGKYTHEPLVLPGGDVLLVTNGGSASARMVNAATGALIADVPSGPLPDGAIYDPASGLVVTSSATGNASVIDPAAKAATGAIAIGGKLEFLAVDGHGRVFNNVESAGEIAVLDLKARTVVARYKLDGCDSPGGLAYVDKADVLVAACDNGVAKVVAAKTGAILATLAIGQGPDAVIYDSVRHTVFSPCGHDGVLDVIEVGKGADAAVVQVVTTEPGARTGAVDPKTGKLYLPTARFGPVPAGGHRAPPLPGTFHLVVVSPQS